MGIVEQQVTRSIIFVVYELIICYHAIHDCKDGAKSLFTLVYYVLNGV